MSETARFSFLSVELPDELPPTQKGRHHEIRALGLREFAGLRSNTQPLDPHKLAKYAKLVVVSFDEIAGLSPETVEHLLGDAKDKWSGGAASRPLPDGSKLIVLNPTHGRNRQNATLMEEICHVFLGHKPSRLQTTRKTKDGKVVARDYDAAIEEEAYATGAAALVPYTALCRMVGSGRSTAQIARHFGVSRALVEYRIKVSRLWEAHKRNHLTNS
ncbi:MAG TPA: ImmA/IrrE family metallo-endopeptidase [Pyrinomonadaceae bacterium]|nr:ImmA/IrrE family metallo-endopeptidase [Pyrinomonadaceae bacterium]